MDHGYDDQAVPGYNIAGAGAGTGTGGQDDGDNVAEDVAEEAPHGIEYFQAGDSEIVAAPERTAAHADSVAPDYQTRTQVPGVDSRLGKTSVPRPVEKTHATRRESGDGIPVAAVHLDAAYAGPVGLGMYPHVYWSFRVHPQ